VGGSGAASNILDQRLEIACMVYRKMIITYPRTHWLHPSRLFDANEPLGNYQDDRRQCRNPF